MEMQEDPDLLVVNLENCISNTGAQQIVKGDCVYTVTVGNTCSGEDSTVIQIPVSVHCSQDGQQTFQLQQHFTDIHSQPYAQLQVSEHLECLVSSNSGSSNTNDNTNGVSEVVITVPLQNEAKQTKDTPQKSKQLCMAPKDIDASYYNEIFEFLSSNTVPEGASEMYKKLLKKRAQNYCIYNGTLHYDHKNPKSVIPDKKTQCKILERTHVEKETGVHLGVRKMHEAINKFHFWRGLYVDVANFVRKCNKCSEAVEVGSETTTKCTEEPQTQHSSKDRTTETEKVDSAPDATSRLESEVWQKVEMRVHGPYPKTDSKNEFILSIVDPFSHWIFAQPVQNSDLAAQIASFVHTTFCCFGFGRCYVVGLSSQLLEAAQVCFRDLSEEIQKTCEQLMHARLPPPLFEKCVSECNWVNTMLDTFVQDNSGVWDKKLDSFLFNYRANTNGQVSSPFFLMFGRKPFSTLGDDKENLNSRSENKTGYPFSKRRRLQSSILQCRHCEEVFTSKISFRIHQRKHTEEARSRGTLEGEEPITLVEDREKRLQRRAALKRKTRASCHNVNSVASRQHESDDSLSSQTSLAFENDDFSNSDGAFEESAPSTNGGGTTLLDGAIHTKKTNVTKDVEKGEVKDVNIVVLSDNSKSNSGLFNPDSKEKGDSGYTCSTCNTTFENEPLLKSHSEKPCDKLFKCTYCLYSSPSSRLFKYHENIHKETHKCSFCSKLFTRNIYLERHILDFHGDQRRFFTCEICDLKFSSNSGLKNHTQSVHEPLKNYSCTVCDYVGRSVNCVKAHIFRNHKKKFKCDKCEYSSLKETGLKKHTHIVHNEDDRQYSCKECPYRAVKRKQLLEHERIVHGPQDKFQCPICKKFCKTQVLMKHHLISHTDQHLYSCKGCTYTTRHRQTLHYHIKHSHPGRKVSDLSVGPSESDYEAIVSAAMIDLNNESNALSSTERGSDGFQTVHRRNLLEESVMELCNEQDSGPERCVTSFPANPSSSPLFVGDYHSVTVATDISSTTHCKVAGTISDQAVTIINGAALTSDEVNTIMSLAGDLSSSKHDFHQLVAVPPSCATGETDMSHVVTYFDSLEALKHSSEQAVSLPDASKLNPDDKLVVSSQDHLLDSMNNQDNIMILPLGGVIPDHSESLSVQPIQMVHNIPERNWNGITAYNIDE